MFIKNTSQLLTEKLDKSQLNLRKIGLNSLEIVLNAVKPKNLIKKSIIVQNNKLIIQNDVYPLKDFEKIYIIGGGKASAEMAFSLEKILKNAIDIEYEGIINIPEGLEIKSSSLTGKIQLNYATHPLPNENGLNGTKKMMEIIKKSTTKDLLFCLISGGGSALLPLPKKNISLKDLQKINSLLLASGATIHEINTIRKHLSDIKGGNIARNLYNSSKATLISLIISDVVGDDLDSIASGPTVPDLTSYEDAIKILQKYNIIDKIPYSAKEILEEGQINGELENPKPGDDCFNNVQNYLIGSVKLAAQNLLSTLSQQSFDAEYFSNEINGEAQQFGKEIYQIITKKIEKNVKSNKIALIGTGELTVTIKGKGIGGRNQEMLLSFLDTVKAQNFDYNFLIIGANLDGIEGNSKAMGALVDNFILNQTIKQKLEINKFLNNNDSNSFFKIIKGEIITGPTGCNVNDLVLILISR